MVEMNIDDPTRADIVPKRKHVTGAVGLPVAVTVTVFPVMSIEDAQIEVVSKRTGSTALPALPVAVTLTVFPLMSTRPPDNVVLGV